MNDNLATNVVLDNVGTNHGALNAGNTEDISVAGKINQALDLSNSYTLHAITPDGTFANGWDKISFTIWIHLDSIVDYAGLVFAAEGTQSLGLQFWNNNKVVIWINGAGGRKNVTTADGDIPTGEWVHIVGTWSQGNAPKIYVNGELKATGTIPMTDVIVQPDVFKLGMDDSNNFRSPDGRLDDIRIYNADLSQTEIDHLYLNGAGTEENLTHAIAEVEVWSSKDGVGDNEEGIQTFGWANGKTVIKGSSIDVDGSLSVSGSVITDTIESTAFKVMSGATERIVADGDGTAIFGTTGILGDWLVVGGGSIRLHDGTRDRMYTDTLKTTLVSPDGTNTLEVNNTTTNIAGGLLCVADDGFTIIALETNGAYITIGDDDLEMTFSNTIFQCAINGVGRFAFDPTYSRVISPDGTNKLEVTNSASYLHDGTRNRLVMDSTYSMLVSPDGANHVAALDAFVHFKGDFSVECATVYFVDCTYWSVGDLENDRIVADSSKTALYSPDGVSILSVTDTTISCNSTVAGLVVPRMTTTERDLLPTTNGSIIYNTTTTAFNFYENGSWVTK